MSRNMYWNMDEMVLPVACYDTAQFATLGRKSLSYGILVSLKYQWDLSHFFPLPLCKPVSGKEGILGIHATASPPNRG